MGRSLRIPGLIDLVQADARPDIRGLADDARLDRKFELRGPLINRLLVLRIRGVLRLAGVPLPSVAPRDDAQRMRELWNVPRWRSPAVADAVVEQCVFAPPSVLRQAAMPGATVCGAVRAGTLVVLELGAARERAASRDVEFMQGNWAQCPAAAFVPALLQAVWKRAIAVPASEAVS